MLQSILSFLQSIGSFFVMIGGFVIDVLTDLAYLIENLLQLPRVFEGGILTILPPVFVTAILAGVSVTIVLRVLGRS